MKSTIEQLKNRIAVASKRKPAELVIKNAEVLNVFTGDWKKTDIAITEGYIAGIGEYEGEQIVDATGKKIVPGLINGHVHIESTMLTPREFSKVMLKHGITTAITDPHEIANVAGKAGLEYMLNASDALPMNIFVNMPSSVPATQFEHNGAQLDAKDITPYFQNSNVLGLAEVMDFPSVANAEEKMLEKIASTIQQGGIVDGHAAGLSKEDLNIYMAAGIRNDHESVSAQEGKDRLEAGMYLMIREGTVAKDLESLLPIINEKNARRCVFVTDDMLLDDLVENGDIDHIIRKAIQFGLDPVMAYQMATLNTSECFGLRELGAVAPGYIADFLILNDENQVDIHQVYKNGKCVVDEGEINQSYFSASLTDANTLPKPCIQQLKTSDFSIQITQDYCNTIEIVPNKIITNHICEKVDIKEGKFVPSIDKDQLLIAVVERHKGLSYIGKGIVKGFQMKEGSIATSVAHDSHNFVVVGTSEDEMLTAIKKVEQLDGGLVVTKQNQVKAHLALPIGGLMSDKGYLDVYEDVLKLNHAAEDIGIPATFNPFLTLSFLTLPVIPALKVTDQGLFDFKTFSHIDIEVEKK
ncbi:MULTISPECIES: adenine deaminase [Oceanobacillus]|uniref:adenine deaminase n=1 Tax=Oceanobacillus TaxID=182709 RepID=UPI00047567D7|nr:adenine deaminase [Oceanobacillus kimchii]MBT2599261.1 adenine deaminase [Oceanobacillus sp. ISL-74]MBT2652179.1 adenine deaminase [Oceanobacillus sp. ISL-73]MCT1578539.1 adenine deaminase [Oceanobacillus kimchii]MCT2136412.1 adenine deaminase [Oceanobacillus kimchii]